MPATKTRHRPKSSPTALPDFVVIGAMKCGTTSLYRYLNHHPQIGLTYEKEISFFCDTPVWQHGVEWYTRQFQHSKTAIRFGDVSPRYSKAHSHPHTVARMSDVVPDVKIIYLVRDPIKRLRSQYVQQFAKMRTDLSFSDYVERELRRQGNALTTSMYMWQIHRYLDRFDAGQIMVVKSEDLLQHRRKTLLRIYDFIGVDHFYDKKVHEREFHQGIRKARPRWYVSWTRNWPGVLKKTLKLRKTSVRPLLFHDVEQPAIPDALQDRLEQVLRPDAEELASFANLEINDWFVP